MNKSDLIERFSHTSGLTQNKAEQLVETFFSCMSQSLENGGRVEIRGFGALAIKITKATLEEILKQGKKSLLQVKRCQFGELDLS